MHSLWGEVWILCYEVYLNHMEVSFEIRLSCPKRNPKPCNLNPEPRVLLQKMLLNDQS